MRRTTEIECVTSGQPDYPARLKEIRDYPKELYYAGDIGILSRQCAAVVGARKTTQYGRNVAVSIGKRLGMAGITVISGMARGIDTCAHRGALDGGGATAAVMGCGLDLCYPPDNRTLKREIEDKGLILCEYAPGTQPKRYHFPQRNRIISGLSEITIVVQAGRHSGSLITADLAAEQGRDVYVVPGNIDSEYHLGSNKLIQEGAIPLICVEDVLQPFGKRAILNQELEKRLSDTEQKVYRLLQEHGELSVDQICYYLKKPPAYVHRIVIVLEMKGFVFSALGKIFIANG